MSQANAHQPESRSSSSHLEILPPQQLARRKGLTLHELKTTRRAVASAHEQLHRDAKLPAFCAPTPATTPSPQSYAISDEHNGKIDCLR